jgi:hypothetical protein
MTSPAFQFYVKQWLGDSNVMLMDFDARGMHLHYMCIAWQMHPPCTLPNDDAVLQKWVGNPSDWNRLKEQIFRAWRLENDTWVQDGLLREYEKQQKFSESRKKNAESGWDKRHNASAKQVHSRTTSKCNALLLQSSSSSSDINTPISPNGDFDAFWKAYPKKKSKGAAEERWIKLHPNKELMQTILSAIERLKQSKDWLKDNGQFIPHPATWLKAKGWNDETTEDTNDSLTDSERAAIAEM